MPNEPDTPDSRKPARRKGPVPPVVIFMVIALFAAWLFFFGPPLADSLNEDTASPLSDVEPAAGNGS